MTNTKDNNPNLVSPRKSKPIVMAFTIILAIATTILVAKVAIVAWELYQSTANKYHPLDSLAFPNANTQNTKSDILPSDILSQLHQTAGTPYQKEPANLKPYPNAKRLTGLERKDRSHIEHIVLWRITDQPLAKVKKHYTQAANQAGFKLLNDKSTPTSTNLQFTAPQRMLIVRINILKKNMRVLLWEIQDRPTPNR